MKPSPSTCKFDSDSLVGAPGFLSSNGSPPVMFGVEPILPVAMEKLPFLGIEVHPILVYCITDPRAMAAFCSVERQTTFGSAQEFDEAQAAMSFASSGYPADSRVRRPVGRSPLMRTASLNFG